MLRVGKIILFREEYTNWLSNSTWSGLKTYTGVTLSRLNCLYIFAYTYMQVMTNNEKRSHELETMKEDTEEDLEGTGKEKII